MDSITVPHRAGLSPGLSFGSFFIRLFTSSAFVCTAVAALFLGTVYFLGNFGPHSWTNPAETELARARAPRKYPTTRIEPVQAIRATRLFAFSTPNDTGTTKSPRATDN